MRKPEQSPTVIHQRDSNKTMENKLKSVESLWMDRLKCKYPQGLNWAKYNPAKRYKLLTALHGKHIAQKCTYNTVQSQMAKLNNTKPLSIKYSTIETHAAKNFQYTIFQRTVNAVEFQERMSQKSPKETLKKLEDLQQTLP